MKGKCLCGSIEVEASEQSELGLCHCTMCRRWTSGPMFAVHCGSEVKFTGEEPARYRSSEWAERGFCSKCGTHLFYHVLGNNEYVLSAGLFQEQNFKLTNQIFIEEKPDFYSFSNKTNNLTGQQVFEQYSNES